MSIATNLKRLRLKAKLSQPALAKKAVVSQQLISQLERGVNDTTKYLPRIAAALGVSVDAIDPTYVAGIGSRSKVLAEIEEIYDRLKGHPEWQEYLLEQARQLESRVLGQEALEGPPRAAGPK